LLVTVPTTLEYHGNNRFGDYWRYLKGHEDCLYTGFKKLFVKQFTVGSAVVGTTYVMRKE
jgi:hypothetical protein